MDRDRLGRTWQRVVPATIITATFVGLTLIITYPVAVGLGSSLAQNPEWGQDAFHHAYVLWWFKKALLNLGTSPADLRLVNFPDGGYYPLLLTYSTVYLAGLPFLLFLSPIATYNLLFLLTFFLSGLSGYALCSYLTGSRRAGLLGGIVYAFFPGRMAHALSGHLELISTYLFPLYLLLLVKTVRQPRRSTTLLCGLTLAGSSLVQPLFIPFLLVPTTLVWLLYEIFVLRRRMNRRVWLALAAVFGLAASLVTPFFWPVLREQAQGQGGYLEAPGLVLFSADLLGIVSPSPLNPILNAIGLVPAYARQVLSSFRDLRESLVYAGIVPLALAAIGSYRRRKVGAWVLLALGAALFSLGPLLKLGGRLVTFTVENHAGAVPLPYTWLMKLPLLSYNRAPARINTTLMLAVAVLAAYGVAGVLARTRSRWQNGVTVTLCLVTVAEFLVVWPCPVFPVQFPSGLADLSAAPDHAAVLNLPDGSWEVTELGLFYQTQHGHPIFDGWIQRSLSGSVDVTRFLDELLSPTSGRDIVPVPSTDTRAAIARDQGVGYISLFTGYARDADAQSKLLEDAFGPALSVDEQVALYRVSGETTLSADEMVYVLPVDSWGAIESWNDRPARWMSDSAELYLWSPGEREGVLRFTALSLLAVERLVIEVNGVALPPLRIGDWVTYTTSSFALRSGLNQITFRVEGGCTPLTGDPRCMGPARAAGASCDPYQRWERCLSVLFQDIHWLDDVAGPAQYPLNITLGDRVRFLGYDIGEESAAGESLALTLYWQTLKADEREHVIFVHLVGPDGILVAQQDTAPLGGSFPAAEWTDGDIFLHPVNLEIPADAPPGEYDLLVGMYTYPDIERLTVASDRPYAQDGLIWLQRVDVQP